MKERMKAFEQIEELAREAIVRLSGDLGIVIEDENFIELLISMYSAGYGAAANDVLEGKNPILNLALKEAEITYVFKKNGQTSAS